MSLNIPPTKEDISVDEFLLGVRKWASNIPEEREKWTFGGLKRTDDGSFKDSDLVELIQAGTDNVAGKSFIICQPPVA